MFLTIAKGEKTTEFSFCFVSSTQKKKNFFSILKRLTTEELFMNVSSEGKKIILMEYAAFHVWRELSIYSLKNLQVAFSFSCPSGVGKKKPFPLIACCLVNLPRGAFYFRFIPQILDEATKYIFQKIIRLVRKINSQITRATVNQLMTLFRYLTNNVIYYTINHSFHRFKRFQ